jgi:hypothetical protein
MDGNDIKEDVPLWPNETTGLLVNTQSIDTLAEQEETEITTRTGVPVNYDSKSGEEALNKRQENYSSPSGTSSEQDVRI